VEGAIVGGQRESGESECRPEELGAWVEHTITWSARSSSGCGIVSPRAERKPQPPVEPLKPVEQAKPVEQMKPVE